ncbi:RNA-binding domain-containing protein, partial [Coccomyxa subellipsoidea C-169]
MWLHLQVYVAHLDPRASEEDVRAMFSPFGPVLNVRIIVDRETGQSKGYGFVTMSAPGQAQAAITGLNGYKMGEKTLTVKMAGNR